MIADRLTATRRLTVSYAEIEDRTGEPVVLVHGNVSSSVFWHSTMAALPTRYRPLAPDLRGFGGTEPLPVDATRGLRDHSEDLLSFLRALALGPVHLVGWSMGGGVVLQLLRDRPDLVRSLTLVNPVSPYGFGGTHGVDGQLNSPDGAGSGAGGAAPEFVRLLREGDLGSASPFAPRSVLDTAYVSEPLAEPDRYLTAMLTTRVGDGHYPGDSRPSDAWPGFAPGERGVLNSMAPTHFRIDDLELVEPKPPILWIRGSADVIVSDTSLFDLAHLGALGLVPGWPGADACPAQPMVTQTRAVLDRYAAAGGRVREVVVEGAGHSVQLERPKEFLAALVEALDGA
ncbi:alpha/beta hydrolase [Kitasatospora paracochleata]|uniref:Pimeloyl-ACP methyl ester carboxylesterase n=1 Tax=Kitasatospora paracochleata TaxID=58354 RepID=A0ABT1IW88_9ACTN|nr:alpha/beta hydrolase [Kitasatospora paracochleata]MCP2309408.1 pimeloyl-ACP methyl ester carboxylesterase [Kitasatospora paracochleata]